MWVYVLEGAGFKDAACPLTWQGALLRAENVGFTIHETVSYMYTLDRKTVVGLGFRTNYLMKNFAFKSGREEFNPQSSLSRR